MWASLYLVHEPAIVPDVFLGLDVQMPPSWEAKEHRSYMIGEFGKPPEVVLCQHGNWGDVVEWRVRGAARSVAALV